MRKVAVLLSFFSVLSAISLDDRCWEVGAELIYWKPCESTYEYAVGVKNANDVRNFSVKPDYNAGFRIFGSTYTNDCCHIWSIDWVYLHTNDHDRRQTTAITVLPGSEVTGNPVVKSKLRYRYNKVNLRAGRYVGEYCDSKIFAFGGVRYIDIERSQETRIVDQVKHVQDARFKGGAFEVGAGVEVGEPCNLRFIGHLSGVMAIGERSLSQKFNDIRYHHPSRLACIPGLDLRVGLEYRYVGSCYWVHLQIGYALEHYFDALSLMASGSSTTTTTQAQGIGFSGPYFSVSARF